MTGRLRRLLLGGGRAVRSVIVSSASLWIAIKTATTALRAMAAETLAAMSAVKLCDVKRALHLPAFLVGVGIGYGLAISIAWSLLTSGVAGHVLSPLLEQNDQFVLQRQLRDIRRTRPAGPRIVVIGDSAFLSQARQSLGAALHPTVVVLSPPTLHNIAILLERLDVAQLTHVIVQNAPWYWTDASPTAFAPLQNVLLLDAENQPVPSIKSLQALLAALRSALRPVHIADSALRGRPVSVLNTTFRGPDAPSQHAVLQRIQSRISASTQLIWVLDPIALPADASPALKKRFQETFRPPAQNLPGKSVNFNQLPNEM